MLRPSPPLSPLHAAAAAAAAHPPHAAEDHRSTINWIELPAAHVYVQHFIALFSKQTNNFHTKNDENSFHLVQLSSAQRPSFACNCIQAGSIRMCVKDESNITSSMYLCHLDVKNRAASSLLFRAQKGGTASRATTVCATRDPGE